MTHTGPSLRYKIRNLFSSSIGEQIDYRIEGSKNGSFYMSKGNVSMIIFLPKGETEVLWDEENGIIAAFQEFSVKIHPYRSLLFSDGKFRKKIENGNLIIEGQGLKITHGGSFLEFKSDGFTFKMINNEIW